MITVIVIDDESVILRNTTKLIEKSDPDFKVIGQASNGEQGYELIIKNKPDLVFADISMPILGGLEMIEKVRNKGLDTTFVILSGYSEFDKAQKAIQLAVKEYLVKPIDPRKLPEFLGKMKNEIISKQNRTIRNYIEQSLFSQIRMENINNELSERKFWISKICIGSYSASRGLHDNIPQNFPSTKEIKNIVLKAFSHVTPFWIFNELVSNEWILVIPEIREINIENEMNQLFRSLDVTTENNISVTLIYAAELNFILELKKELKKIDKTMFNKLIFSRSTIINSSTDTAKESLPEELTHYLERVKILSKNRNRKIVDETVRKILLLAEKDRLSQENLISLLREIIENFNWGFSNRYISELISSTVYNSENYTELYRNFMLLIQRCLEEITIQDSNSRESNIIKIKNYLSENFNHSISIQNLAEEFDFNYTYLCVQFKKEFGHSPNEYLIHKRVETAKDLLKHKQYMEIKDIALSVGYEDAYYFSRIFKSNTGHSPSEYRKLKI